KTEIHQRERTQVGLDAERRQRQAGREREEHSDERAQHPTRKRRAGKLDDRRAAREGDDRRGPKHRDQRWVLRCREPERLGPKRGNVTPDSCDRVEAAFRAIPFPIDGKDHTMASNDSPHADRAKTAPAEGSQATRSSWDQAIDQLREWDPTWA